MIKAENVVKVERATFLINKQAKKLALLSILKTGYEHISA